MNTAVQLAPRIIEVSDRRVVVHGGTLEAIKWLALVLMTGDHVNAILFDWSERWLYDAGRLVMPLFGFVLAYNLARPGAMERGVHLRVMKRLSLYAVLATPAYVIAHGWWPLNILWTLCLFTFVTYCIERDTQTFTALAWVGVGIGGMFVEFWWPALMCCLGAWAFCKRFSYWSVVVWLSGTAALFLVNHNWWAFAAYPIILVAPYIRIEWPRISRFFYAYYPAHLSVLCIVGWIVGPA